MAYFSRYFAEIPERSALRIAITRQTRSPEATCMKALLPWAMLNATEEAVAGPMALKLARILREDARPGIVEQLVQEFSLSSDEGVALMSLAEALLRTPDTATRDALIKDQICLKDWLSHGGEGSRLVPRAASWGLAVTSIILDNGRKLGSVSNLIRCYGEPLIRRAVQYVIQMMGSQFVLGETVPQALKRAGKREERGFTYSYDMLGEAALDQQDAARYQAAYHSALEQIGKVAIIKNVQSLYERPGLSIKLSALHPRYDYSQRERVLTELLPVVKSLALRARHYDIGLTIDAEESERLELSLDVLEALCRDPDLAGWQGLGFVVQAYGKRAALVLDYLIDLARQTNRRLMIRLVKGAYWDSEIKKAQSDGVEDFPVFTRKSHTDVSYLACARQLLDAGDAVFPQFATHNARSVASIYAMAGQVYKNGFEIGQYEFQGLHGMGEDLYDAIVGEENYNRPCRLYAPVGTYETLLAYLVRRLLENGANSSFVNLLNNPAIALERLVEDPVSHVLEDGGAGHAAIVPPPLLYGENRKNSKGMDLADERVLITLRQELSIEEEPIEAGPLPRHQAEDWRKGGTVHEISNPADPDDRPGCVVYTTKDEVRSAVDKAQKAFTVWAEYEPQMRAAILERTAELLEKRQAVFIALAVREAGKTYANSVAEIREAVDFLRYYAAEIRTDFDNKTHKPLGPVVCISPWNFPLAIFMGQIAASLAAGNSVLAKPAEETPLIAYKAVHLLYEAGLPEDVVHYLPGEGDIGAALVADERIAGVMFTGSTAVAQAIARQLAGRIGRNGQPVPLVAETGGQNAMIVDSTALAEQVVRDILVSAFDSAGQRCSALRLLCVQDDAAPRILSLLKGAMAELAMGNPALLKTDIGPVITQEAAESITSYCESFRQKNYKVFSACRQNMPKNMTIESGYFVAPTLIEIHSLDDLTHEVFGPVLHVLRYPRIGLSGLMKEIGATGFGLTCGVHSRLRSVTEFVTEQSEAGNIYINRNMVGAVVGVQPFGGRGLSGTGPKAGGPFTVRRQLAHAPLTPFSPILPRKEVERGVLLPAMARSWLLWLTVEDYELARDVMPWMEHGLLGMSKDMPSPVGERNIYSLCPRGRVLVLAATEDGLKRMISYALSCGNEVAALCTPEIWASLSTMAQILHQAIIPVRNKKDIASCSVILFEQAEKDGLVWQIMEDLLNDPQQPVPLAYHADPASLRPEMLLEEKAVSINIAAVGGNAKLMAVI